MAKELPDGYYIKRIRCDSGSSDFVLYQGTRFVSMKCCWFTPKFWAVWRLRRQAKFYAKNRIK